jgi:hypothetical protein
MGYVTGFSQLIDELRRSLKCVDFLEQGPCCIQLCLKDRAAVPTIPVARCVCGNEKTGDFAAVLKLEPF